jgi:hypothetical protein
MDAVNQLTYTVLADISSAMTPRNGDPSTAHELWLEVRRKVAQAIVDAVEMGAREATEAQTVGNSKKYFVDFSEVPGQQSRASGERGRDEGQI